MSPILKKSKQRDAILSFLESRTDHPSADVIYMHMRKIMPNISLGTVYRNLGLLCELGQITKLPCDDKIDRYDCRVTPHNHFICDQCGCVMDLEMDSIDYIKETASENFGGQISSYHVFFHGMCENCFNESLDEE
ncbi:MAG: transcriptional repressor [Firmicutes bacterium]|uniref:Transcriptional repressor n=1 Tax=Candidatus Scybalomonas excrementavium TaxID=2840943 RepID=A0A9D9HZL0_9FIRM|nr:transcriptional repressor [Candidatus Scybalomonas excrementavium]